MLEKHCEDDARHMARSPSDAALTSVAEVVGKMTSFLESIGDVDATLEQMCDNLVDAVPGADAAGVTVIRRGRPVTIVVTDGCVRAVDRAQYDADEGPCLEAATTRTPVRVTSGVAAQRYSEFWTRNADTGMRSFLSTPVSVGDERYGALNLYSRSDHGFEHADADTSTICVTVVESLLAIARRADDAQRQVDGLRAALESRAVIDQCKGIVMVVLDITDDQAFALIRWRSQETNTPVRLLCRQILADLSAEPLGEGLESTVGTVLMTAHTRVAAGG